PARSTGETPAADSLYLRRAHAFGYGSAGGALELQTEVLEPLPAAAVVREAILTTTVDPHGPRRQHLVLRIASDRSQQIDMALPPGATLARVLRDGAPVVPTREGEAVSIPVVTPRAARSFSTITVAYLTPPGSFAGDCELRPELPALSLPCLSFCWEIAAPEP